MPLLMIERSLDLMSKEQTETNTGLRNQLIEQQHNDAALTREKDGPPPRVSCAQ